MALIPGHEVARLPSHEIRLHDAKAQDEKISAEVAERRGAHLARLGPLDDLVRELTPLPVSYDVMRLQPPYFFEFTYTEMLGCVWITPQSSELSARVVASALDECPDWPFSPSDHLPLRDKYDYDEATARPREVAFLPGSNIFEDSVSPEVLRRLLHEDENIVIKPHPLSNMVLVRDLGRAFGYGRVLRPDLGAVSMVPSLKVAHVTTSTEMGLYAVLNGVRINNLTRYPFEPRGTYTPFYRLLWGLPKVRAKTRLEHLLDSPLSGFFHPDDPDVREKMQRYFANAMAIRAQFRPFVQEFTADRWADLISPPRAAPQARPAPQPQKGPADAVG